MRKSWKFLALGSAAVCMFGLAGCGSDNNNNNNSAPAGVYKLNLAGGTGGTADGGNGNNLYVYSAGDVNFSRAGGVDASFTVPTYTKNFGEVKATISADTTVGLDTTDVGGYFMLTNVPNLYLDGGDGIVSSIDDKVVTGLQINAGKTIKFPNNFPAWDSKLGYVWFDNAVVVDGTVTVKTEGDSLYFECGSVMQINASGKVTTATTTAGINSGYLYVYGSVGINQGIISTDATVGASAGYAEFYGDVFAFNTGTISANGGNDAAGSGYNAADVSLDSYYAGLFNSGTLSANGGNGGNGVGGSAGSIYIAGADGGYMGGTTISGTLVAKGGNGTAGNSGGKGGYIEVYNRAGRDLKINASFFSPGGAGTGAGANGGDGGGLYISQEGAEYDYEYGGYAPAGDIYITGNIDLSGGNGAAVGGNAGYFNIYNNNYTSDHIKDVATLNLVGFNGINVSGGDSTASNGGSAGYVEIYASSSHQSLDVDLGGGAVYVDLPVTAKGGNGAMTGGFFGGTGGWVEYESGYYDSPGTYTLKNHAPIDVSGGTGDFGGDAGGAYFYGLDLMENTGNITANGGNGTTQGGVGADGSVEMYSTLNLLNSGAILASGGSGETGGQGGYYISMYAGGQVTNSGQIKANGGNGTIDGGSGGEVDLFSQTRPTANSGQLNVAKGTGGTTAANGTIWLDWVDVTPTSGTL